MKVKTEAKIIVTLNQEERDALDEALWFLFNEVGEKKFNNHFDEKQRDILDTISFSL